MVMVWLVWWREDAFGFQGNGGFCFLLVVGGAEWILWILIFALNFAGCGRGGVDTLNLDFCSKFC